MPEKVVAIARTRRGMVVRTNRAEYESDHVLGADGANSLVRKTFAAPFTRAQLSTAAGYYVHGASSSEIVLKTTGEQPGYLWSFPRPDHLAIGICAPADAGITAGDLRARAIAWAGRARLGAGLRLDAYAWPIPTLDAHDYDALATAGPRWGLVGDAAGLVDPITREGIYFAIASGGWLADALLGGDADAYRERLHDEAVPELERAARFKAAFFRPAFTGLLVGALRQSAAIRSVMADLIAGRQSYRALKWRLLGTFEWGLAVRALAGRAGWAGRAG